MNNNGNSRFFDGFMLGIIVGALGVFLFGTKSGKNLIKIISEEGLEGLSNLMQEYDLTDFGQEFEQEQEAPKKTSDNNHQTEEINEVKEEKQEPIVEKAPKKRFFKRLRN